MRYTIAILVLTVAAVAQLPPSQIPLTDNLSATYTPNKWCFDGVVTAGTNTLTTGGTGDSCVFAAGDVGKAITVLGAGAASGGTFTDLTTTIASFVSAGSVTLASNAQNTVSKATVSYCCQAASYNLGLYYSAIDGSTNTVPAVHSAASLTFLSNIFTRDANGNSSPAGIIGFMSVGMSNTKIEYSKFLTTYCNVTAGGNSTVGKGTNFPCNVAGFPISSNVTLINGAQDGVAVCAWQYPIDSRGTVNANGTTTVTWNGGELFSTAWTGATVDVQNAAYTISSVPSTTTMILTQPVPTGSAVGYFHYTPVSSIQCSGNAPNPYARLETVGSGNQELGCTGCPTPQQIQVVWLKETVLLAKNTGAVNQAYPPNLPVDKVCPPSHTTGQNTCADSLYLEYELANVARALKTTYPNLQMVFLTSRMYGGYGDCQGSATCPPNNSVGQSKSMEPFTYEDGFAVRAVVETQIAQADRSGGPDPLMGTVNYTNTPWLAWGPYVWNDGPNPRADGLAICHGAGTDGRETAACTASPGVYEDDMQGDAVHPNGNGSAKIATQMWNFFSASTFTTPWFVQ